MNLYSEEGTLLASTPFHLGKKEGESRFYYLSGALHTIQYFKAGIKVGTHTSFYENGQMKSEVPYLEGSIHGIVTLFWEDGSIKRQLTYHLGKKEGQDTLFSREGKVIFQGSYREGLPIGLHIFSFEERFYHTPTCYNRKVWDESGSVIYEGTYSKDLKKYEEKKRGVSGKLEIRQGVNRDGRIHFT
ncbi:MAG: hypothetical protein RLZZ453_684 [Chlamydiota bacterium]|jgi:antitoxin component YwqK of YwqJK toxin-antitoxin module